MASKSTDFPVRSGVPSRNPTPEFDFYERGVFVALGTTCYVERLADGNILKRPWPEEGHNTSAERDIEVSIYHRIGDHERLVPKIEWNPEAKELILKRMINGTLKDYLIEHPETPPERRLQWAIQVAEGLQLVHSVGVVHYDVGPQNFLLDEDLNLKISDFGGSSVDGSRPTICAGPRYTPPNNAWCRGWDPFPAGDLFGLGSIIYFIATGTHPFHEVDEDNVDRFVETQWENDDFSDADGVLCGDIIKACWRDKFTSASEVLAALKAVDIKELCGGGNA